MEIKIMKFWNVDFVDLIKLYFVKLEKNNPVDVLENSCILICNTRLYISLSCHSLFEDSKAISVEDITQIFLNDTKFQSVY